MINTYHVVTVQFRATVEAMKLLSLDARAAHRTEVYNIIHARLHQLGVNVEKVTMAHGFNPNVGLVRGNFSERFDAMHLNREAEAAIQHYTLPSLGLDVVFEVVAES